MLLVVLLEDFRLSDDEHLETSEGHGVVEFNDNVDEEGDIEEMERGHDCHCRCVNWRLGDDIAPISDGWFLGISRLQFIVRGRGRVKIWENLDRIQKTSEPLLNLYVIVKKCNNFPARIPRQLVVTVQRDVMLTKKKIRPRELFLVGTWWGGWHRVRWTGCSFWTQKDALTNRRAATTGTTSCRTTSTAADVDRT